MNYFDRYPRPADEFNKQATVNGVKISVGWDGAYGSYTIYFPQVDLDRAREFGLSDQIAMLGENRASAVRAFEFASRMAQSLGHDKDAPYKILRAVEKNSSSIARHNPSQAQSSAKITLIVAEQDKHWAAIEDLRNQLGPASALGWRGKSSPESIQARIADHQRKLAQLSRRFYGAVEEHPRHNPTEMGTGTKLAIGLGLGALAIFLLRGGEPKQETAAGPTPIPFPLPANMRRDGNFLVNASNTRIYRIDPVTKFVYWFGTAGDQQLVRVIDGVTHPAVLTFPPDRQPESA